MKRNMWPTYTANIPFQAAVTTIPFVCYVHCVTIKSQPIVEKQSVYIEMRWKKHFKWHHILLCRLTACMKLCDSHRNSVSPNAYLPQNASKQIDKYRMRSKNNETLGKQFSPLLFFFSLTLVLDLFICHCRPLTFYYYCHCCRSASHK